MAGWIAAIGAFFKIVMFFLDLWGEKRVAKSKKKAEVAKEVVDALAETDTKKRLSKLNLAINNINRVR